VAVEMAINARIAIQKRRKGRRLARNQRKGGIQHRTFSSLLKILMMFSVANKK